MDTIILDEPTNHLDIRHQLFLLNYLKQSGKTILIVIHDLRLASYYCDTLYLMKEGRVLSHGTPREVLTREQVEKDLAFPAIWWRGRTEKQISPLILKKE